MFKDITKLKASTASSYADYNNDRIIFYPTSGSAGSADFTAAVRLYFYFLIHLLLNSLFYSGSPSSFVSNFRYA